MTRSSKRQLWLSAGGALFLCLRYLESPALSDRNKRHVRERPRVLLCQEACPIFKCKDTPRSAVRRR
jgi:hypothetical protein